MQGTLESTAPVRASRWMRVAGIGLLCTAFCATCAWGQLQPVGPAPDSKPAATPKDQPGPSVKPGVPTTQPVPKAKPKRKTKPRPRKRAPKKAQYKPDPNAKWACDQMTVELPPVWRGKKKLTFSFDIRNEGTANLRIGARGG